MNTKISDPATLRHDINKIDFSNPTIDANAVKKVVRETWESKLKEGGTASDLLDKHAEFMANEFGSLNYEGICMKNIAAHAAHMSKGELAAYTSTVEALAVGYKSRFGSDFSGLLLAGLTLVSKDLTSMHKHFDYFLLHLLQRSGVCATRMEREIARLGRLNAVLARKNSGFFRFLRKKEIASLKKRISVLEARVNKLQARKTKYEALSLALKSKAFSRPKL